MQRSEWAEQFAAAFAGIPLVREFVLPNPKYANKGVAQEVCDFILTLRRRCIVCQMKAQEDPDIRTGDKLEKWIRKKAIAGASQLSGALSTMRREPIWCEHPRRGRIDLAVGDLMPVHGMVLLECHGVRVELEDIPLDLAGIPVTYMDASDFLNVLDQLRSFSDVDDYVTARTALGADVRHAIGGEQVVLEHFILQNGSFSNWTSYSEAARTGDAERAARDMAFIAKVRADRKDTMQVEHVSDLLATRSDDYADGLTPETVARFDDPARRQRYLLMQEDLADLPLPCRRKLGEGLRKIQEKIATGTGARMTWAAAHFDVKPAFVYVLIGSRCLPKQTDYDRALSLLAGGAAYFRKRTGMAILDRGTGGFEIITLPDHEPTEEMRLAGARQFGDLKMTDGLSTLMP